MIQKDIFLKSEANEWYTRNMQSLRAVENYIDIDMVLPYLKKNTKIIEIGCADGCRLDYLMSKAQLENLELFGVDPSDIAISNGMSNYTKLNLTVGTADNLPHPNDYFDVVIIGFCLYLIDRNLIFKVFAEVDRVLKHGGFVLMTDFMPDSPKRVKYSHKEGVYSYKNDHSKYLTCCGHYSVVNTRAYSLLDNLFSLNDDERVASILMYKEYYEDIYKETEINKK